jgi:sialate O-acetylesterase
LRVWFDHADGLTSRANVLSGFEVAGSDHHFIAAEARVEGATVLVRTATLQHPTYVRFGWMGVVSDNLYNAAGLPASTFSSERNPLH